MTKATRIEVNTVHVVLVYAKVHFVIEDIPRPHLYAIHIHTFMPYFVGLVGMYCMKERRL